MQTACTASSASVPEEVSVVLDGQTVASRSTGMSTVNVPLVQTLDESPMVTFTPSITFLASAMA